MTGRLPVVLLHGWPVTELHWRHLAPRLRDAGFVPLPVTLPGLGSGDDGAGDFRKSALAARVRDRLAADGIARCAVIGHDWGGTVAIHLAAGAPQTVSALVVEEEILPGIAVAVPSPGSEHYPDWHGAFNRAPGLAETLVPGREDAFYGAFLRASAGPAGLDPAALAAYVDAYRPTDVHVAGLVHYHPRGRSRRYGGAPRRPDPHPRPGDRRPVRDGLRRRGRTATGGGRRHGRRPGGIRPLPRGAGA